MILPHPAYLPDIDRFDYPLFKSVNNLFTNLLKNMSLNWSAKVESISPERWE